MAADDPASPGGLEELHHDVIRLRWEEKAAYSCLLDQIDRFPDATAALARWREIHERRVLAQERLDTFLRMWNDRERGR